MIKRPNGLIKCEVDLIFNNDNYYCLELDLLHINGGKDGTRKSSYKIAVAAGIAFDLIDGLNKIPENVKQYENGICEYYLVIGKYKLKSYKIVFCICSDRPRTIGVMTLFRL